MGGRADLEVHVRVRNAQLPEEVLRHLLVIVLARVHEPVLDAPRTLVHGPDEGCNLHEIGAGPHDIQDLHRTLPDDITRSSTMRITRCASFSRANCARNSSTWFAGTSFRRYFAMASLMASATSECEPSSVTT